MFLIQVLSSNLSSNPIPLHQCIATQWWFVFQLKHDLCLFVSFCIFPLILAEQPHSLAASHGMRSSLAFFTSWAVKTARGGAAASAIANSSPVAQFCLSCYCKKYEFYNLLWHINYFTFSNPILRLEQCKGLIELD